jgi:hypothetical protein
MVLATIASDVQHQVRSMVDNGWPLDAAQHSVACWWTRLVHDAIHLGLTDERIAA